MTRPRATFVSIAPFVLLAASAGLAPIARTSTTATVQTAFPDANLAALYTFDPGLTQVSYSVCGPLNGSSGCRTGATLGPFAHVCSVIEGDATFDAPSNTVSRAIYVVESGGGASSAVTLYAYLRQDAIAGPVDTITNTLTATVPLPLVGDATAQCSMAANHGFLFVGTNQGAKVAKVRKSGNVASQVGTAPGAQVVSSITANFDGFVNVDHTDTGTGAVHFDRYDASGALVGSGAGAQYLLDVNEGLATGWISPSNALGINRASLRPGTFVAPGRVSTQDAARPDTGLAASYSLDANFQNIAYTVCGTLNGTPGCFGSGTIGPFGKITGLIEGAATYNARLGVVSRHIYIVDRKPIDRGVTNSVFDYLRTDTISGSSDTVAVSQANVSRTAMQGGDPLLLVANDLYLYLGSNAAWELTSQVAKANLGHKQMLPPGIDQTYYTTSVTVDHAGFVNFNYRQHPSGANAHYFLYKPNSTLLSDGAGDRFVVGTRVALDTTQLVAQFCQQPACPRN